MKRKNTKCYSKKIGNRYYLSLCIDEDTKELPFIPKRIIGLYLGIKDIVVTEKLG